MVDHTVKSVIPVFNICVIFYFYPATRGPKGHGSSGGFLQSYMPFLTSSSILSQKRPKFPVVLVGLPLLLLPEPPGWGGAGGMARGGARGICAKNRRKYIFSRAGPPSSPLPDCPIFSPILVFGVVFPDCQAVFSLNNASNRS